MQPYGQKDWILRISGYSRAQTASSARSPKTWRSLNSGLAAAKLYDFIWSEYCDWYIEMAKPRLYGEDPEARGCVAGVLRYVLTNALKLLHPFMPFITEEIYVELLEAGESIMISNWPTAEAAYDFPGEEGKVADIMELIRSVRNIRQELNVPAAKKAQVIVRTARPGDVRAAETYILRLASASSLTVLPLDAPEPAGAASAVAAIGEIFVPLGDLIDKDKELARLEKEQANLEGEIARASGKLANENFTAKAPAHVVEEERKKLAKYTDMLDKVKARIAATQAL